MLKRVNFSCVATKNRWEGLDFSKIPQVFDDKLESTERKRRTIYGILDSGKVSPVARNHFSEGFIGIIDVRKWKCARSILTLGLDSTKV